jgi:Tol biopolymer transport system component
VFWNTPGTPGRFRAEVWTMNADGSGKKRLYRSGCCFGFGAPPIWSPNGRRIAFSASSPAGTFVINADGTGLRRISPNLFNYLAWRGVPQH